MVSIKYYYYYSNYWYKLVKMLLRDSHFRLLEINLVIKYNNLTLYLFILILNNVSSLQIEIIKILSYLDVQSSKSVYSFDWLRGFPWEGLTCSSISGIPRSPHRMQSGRWRCAGRRPWSWRTESRVLCHRRNGDRSATSPTLVNHIWP